MKRSHITLGPMPQDYRGCTGLVLGELIVDMFPQNMQRTCHFVEIIWSVWVVKAYQKNKAKALSVVCIVYCVV